MQKNLLFIGAKHPLHEQTFDWLATKNDTIQSPQGQ